MLKHLTVVALVLASAAPLMAKEPAAKKTALDYKVNNINGKEVDLNQYKGKVLLIVNVASKCGKTPQYKDLQALHEKYGEKGLKVMGFPCNQFGGQEPGTNAEVLQFCQDRYDVTFDMFAKIDVNGKKQHELYKHLTTVAAKPKGAGKVSWNFEKFLVDREGNVVGRYSPNVKPTSPLLTSQIEAELKK